MNIIKPLHKTHIFYLILVLLTQKLITGSFFRYRKSTVSLSQFSLEEFDKHSRDYFNQTKVYILHYAVFVNFWVMKDVCPSVRHSSRTSSASECIGSTRASNAGTTEYWCRTWSCCDKEAWRLTRTFLLAVPPKILPDLPRANYTPLYTGSFYFHSFAGSTWTHRSLCHK